MEKEILVLDVEATDVNTKKALLLELGAVVLNIETGRVRKVFSATFKDPDLRQKHHKSWIFDNSDMTIDEIRKSKSLEFYREKIQKIFTKYSGRITAWNRPYDAAILERYGFDLGEEMGDPMRISTDFFGLKQKNGTTPKCAKVPEAAKALGIVNEDFEEAHRGLDDARLEASIIYYLIKKGIYNG